MQSELKLPKLPARTANATVRRWLRGEGEAFGKGEVLVRLDAERAQLEVEATAPGTLQSIQAPAGTTLEAGAVLATLGEGAAPAAPPTPKEDSKVAASKQSGSGSADKVQPILLPKAGNDMEEGSIVAWKVAEGDSVAEGDVLFELETDKTTLDVESEVSGTLRRILVGEDELVAVMTPVGLVGESDDDIEAWLAEHGTSAAAEAEPEAPASEPEPTPAVPAPQPAAPQAAAPSITSGRPKASPAARRFAAERGVNLGAVGAGSGPGGRILSTDVLAAPAGGMAAPGIAPQQPRQRVEQTVAVKKPSGMRKAIAKNLSVSKQTVPHFYMKMDIEVDRFLEFAKLQKMVSGASVNVCIVSAVGRAMAKFPELRSQWKDDGIHEFSNANIGVAVAVEDGLRVPVVMDVDQLTLAELAGEVRAAVDAARAGQMHNAGKATFTISNLGMTEVEEFAAIINPPEAGILAVGKPSDRAVVVPGAIVSKKIMTVWLSADHRTVDGMVAAQFMGELKAVFETPELLAQ